MPRFYIEPKNVFHGKFLITDDNVCNHLRQVLRIDKGAVIELFDGIGNQYKAEIKYLDKKQVSGLILEKTSIEEPWPYLVLAQALPRAGKADEIVRMNTEAGVSEFVFYKSEYSVPPLESYDVKKIERLQRVAIEAARQSERALMPKIRAVMKFEEILNNECDNKFILHSREVEGAISIKEIDKEALKGKTSIILIGPEGGFSPKEIEKAKSKGFTIIHLPLPILRTETAGVVAASQLLM